MPFVLIGVAVLMIILGASAMLAATVRVGDLRVHWTKRIWVGGALLMIGGVGWAAELVATAPIGRFIG